MPLCYITYLPILRFVWLAGLLLCFSATVFPQNPALSITPVTNNIYVFVTHQKLDNGQAYPANGMYLVTDAGVVLIDTPWDTTQCQPLLDSITARHHQRVVMSLSTHSHEDRTGGLDFLKKQGVKTYSTYHTRDLCIKNENPQAEHLFRGDTVFTVGNHTFEVCYPGEGHTADNIVVWFGQERLLYGGCFIKSTEAPDLGNMAEANVTAWPASLRRVQKKFPNPRYVIPGHLGWKNKRSIQHTLALLKKHKP